MPFRTGPSSRRPTLALLALAVLAAPSGCNEHPLIDLSSQVKIQRADIYTQASRTEIDVLWVVDNSSSMCEEQASLSSHFNTFVEGLAGLKANFHLGVVATEVDHERPDVAGRLRYAPAKVNSQHCVNYVACSRDLHCGTGGCLCGLPWVRRCAGDEECEAGEVCLSHPLPEGGRSVLSYCAPACGAEEECQGGISAAARTLHCLDGRCQLQLCEDDAGCPAGQRCLPVESEDGAIKACRRFRDPGITCTPGTRGAPCPLDTVCTEAGTCESVGFCPPQTCDCPKSLSPILEFDPDAAAGAPGQLSLEELRHRFRCLALLGTDGSTYEKGLEAAERALTPPLAAPGGANAGFLREGAYLVVVFLSDENDCSDRGKSCTTKADCPDPENYACRKDPVDPSKSYCRIPQRETQECEYWSNRLMDVQGLAAQFKDLKATDALVTDQSCTKPSDCPDDGTYCSPRFGKCTRDSGRVIMAGIVGDRNLFCTTGCPAPDGRTCELSDDCAPCPEGLVCAERTYKQGVRDIPPTCQDPTFGSAYSGRRYHELLDEFGDHAVTLSICRGQIADALQEIAGLVASVVPSSYCLVQPLPTCAKDTDCLAGGRCLTDAGTLNGSPPFCVWNETGETARLQPQQLVVEIRSAAGVVSRVPGESWRFHPSPTTYTLGPSTATGAGGCIAFDSGAPQAGESLLLRYLTTVTP